jgi:hypothetical protein
VLIRQHEATLKSNPSAQVCAPQDQTAALHSSGALTCKDVAPSAEHMQQHSRAAGQPADLLLALGHSTRCQSIAQWWHQDAANGRPQGQHACAAWQPLPQLDVLVQVPVEVQGRGRDYKHYSLTTLGQECMTQVSSCL